LPSPVRPVALSPSQEEVRRKEHGIFYDIKADLFPAVVDAVNQDPTLLGCLNHAGDATPLVMAIIFERVVIAKFLIGQVIEKFGPSASTRILCPALYVACCAGDEGMVEALLSKGVDATLHHDEVGELKSPLIAAIKCGASLACVKLLLANETAITSLNEAEQENTGTALYYAYRNGYVEIVETLLEAGASISDSFRSRGNNLDNPESCHSFFKNRETNSDFGGDPKDGLEIVIMVTVRNTSLQIYASYYPYNYIGLRLTIYVMNDCDG